MEENKTDNEEIREEEVGDRILKTAVVIEKKNEAIETIKKRRDAGRIEWTEKQVKIMEAMLGGETDTGELAKMAGANEGYVKLLLKKREFNEFITQKTLENEDIYRAEMYRLTRGIIGNKIKTDGLVSKKDLLDCIEQMNRLQKNAPVSINIDNRKMDLEITLSQEQIDELVDSLFAGQPEGADQGTVSRPPVVSEEVV